MSQWRGFVFRAAVVIVLGSASSAFGQRGEIRDDQIPWGPNGTIGRGTDNLPEWMRHHGNGIVLFSAGARSPAPGFAGWSSPYPSVLVRPATRAVPGPNLTTRYYEPGDGYRYPLYYNPATGTFFYYPVGW